jgi:hypothetical protein
MNGSIPDLSGARYPIGGRSAAQLGFTTFGSDSGHQMTPGPQDSKIHSGMIGRVTRS